MRIIIALLVLASLTTACAARDENYYIYHPEALQTALQQCPGKSPAMLSCEKLDKISGRLNTLGYELRYSPQAYGKRILTLQQEVAALKKQLNNPQPEENLKQTLQAKEEALYYRLAVVKWLESPKR